MQLSDTPYHFVFRGGYKPYVNVVSALRRAEIYSARVVASGTAITPIVQV
jgi:hypothetical protein